MKYMIEYAVRRSGSLEQIEANAQTLIKAFSKWQPEDGLTVNAFVAQLDGGGGYVLVEATDPKAVVTFTHKFVVWNDIKVVPVVDVAVSAEIALQTMAWRAQVLGG
jgi:Protein of unknown function (DUF3303)